MKKTFYMQQALLALLFFVVGMGEALAAWDGKSKTEPKTEKIDGKTFYLIESEANLAWFSDTIYKAGGTSSLNAKLTKSLDMSGQIFMPIAAGMGKNMFAGTFDGDGFTISNIYIDAGKIAEVKNPSCDSTKAACNAQNSGFIAVMSGGTVKNLNIENIYITASASAGEILGKEQPVTVGGIVAWQKGGTIENCTVSGKILASGSGNGVGGIVGNAWNGTIKNSLSSVSIYASGNETYVGGVVGFIRGKTANDKVAVESCAYDGTVVVNSGDGKSGGIVGYYELGSLDVSAAYFGKDVVSDGVGRKSDSLTLGGSATGVEELNVEKVACGLNGGEFKDDACSKAGVWSTGEVHLVVNGVSRNESGALVFEVVFDANGGVFRAGDKTSKLLKVGDKITSAEIIPPTRGDTVFAGWALAVDAEAPDENLGVADKAKTVYAVWKKMFKVTFDANGSAFAGDSKTKAKLVAEGETIDVEGIDLPQNFTNEEDIKFYFSGWAFSADADAALESLGAASGDTTLYAVWTEAPTFSVTFDTRGFGAFVEYVQEGNKVVSPDKPKADGYKFVGWFTDSTFAEGTEYDFEQDVNENFTLYAKWSLVEYEILYLMGKGANNEANPVSYTIETPTVKLQPPTRTGYVFDGWYYDKEYINTATQITEGSTGNVKLYAKWETKTFSITYMGGEFALEIVAPVVKTYGEAVKLKDISYTRNGYLQDGWSTEDAGKKVYDLGAEYSAEEDVVLYPHWKEDPTVIPSRKVVAAQFNVAVRARSLEISGAKVGAEVSVFDIHGRTVVRKVADASTFNVGSFTPGVYVVRVGMQARRVAIR